jgi:hypothetical protein
MDRQSPEISVLLSCYNGSVWLPAAITSVLGQTYTPFEFVIVDDGSTDRSWSIIQNYSDQDKRIRAIKKENTGLTDSLNVGIRAARGRWIARIDADDLNEPTRLAEQIGFLRLHPGMVLLGSGFAEIDARGSVIRVHRRPFAHGRLVRDLRRLQRFFPHSSAMFRRDVALKVGGYNVRFRKAQDWDLWLRMAELGEISCLSKPLVKIRKHADQISASSAGSSQFAYSAAASVCHLLRVATFPDPSTASSEATWLEFFDWVQARIVEEGSLLRREAWGRARALYFATGHPSLAAIRFLSAVLQSGYALRLTGERLFGLSLPAKLAHQWMEARSAVSKS